MLTYNDVQEIYARNHGTTNYYHRNYYTTLAYTDGVFDFQKSLEAYWVVDNVISYMPYVLDRFNKEGDSFYVVKISFDKERFGYMEIYTEGYVDDIYDEHITVIKQEIPLIDLPIDEEEETTEYKMYLQLGNDSPLQFVLMLTSEY
ncbi:hypothetical protein IJD44_10480 [bacterium]|nr:hypothetical protein [bacterium]